MRKVRASSRAAPTCKSRHRVLPCPAWVPWPFPAPPSSPSPASQSTQQSLISWPLLMLCPPPGMPPPQHLSGIRSQPRAVSGALPCLHV